MVSARFASGKGCCDVSLIIGQSSASQVQPILSTSPKGRCRHKFCQRQPHIDTGGPFFAQVSWTCIFSASFSVRWECLIVEHRVKDQATRTSRNDPKTFTYLVSTPSFGPQRHLGSWWVSLPLSSANPRPQHVEHPPHWSFAPAPWEQSSWAS